MKQTNTKIFEECWYDTQNCEECSYYRQCLEEQQRNERYAKGAKVIKAIVKLTLILAIIAIIALIINFAISNMETVENQINEPQTTEQVIEEPKEPIEKVPALSAEGPSEVYYYEVSDEEKLMMAKLVWAEARGESYEGKVAVAAVVLNRYRFNENPWDFDNDTIASVILQKNQFASISNVTMQDLQKYPDCMPAVEDACKGWDPTRATFEDGALYFYNPDKVSESEKNRREGLKMMTIGDHDFHYEYENKVKG